MQQRVPVSTLLMSMSITWIVAMNSALGLAGTYQWDTKGILVFAYLFGTPGLLMAIGLMKAIGTKLQSQG